MSDGSLSQEEIDALLQGTETLEMDSSDIGFEGSAFSDQDKDIFKKILESVVSSQSSNLSMLTSQNVKIQNPAISLMTPDELKMNLQDAVVEIKTNFADGISGEHSTIFTESLGLTIAGSMLGQDGVELNEMALSTIAEAVSNIMGPAVTAIGNKINATIKTTPPVYQRVEKEDLSLPGQGDPLVVVEYPVTIGSDSSTIMDIYSLSLAKDITSMIARFEGGSNGMTADDPFAAMTGGKQTGQKQNQNMGNQNMMGQNMGNMMGNQNMMNQNMGQNMMGQNMMNPNMMGQNMGQNMMGQNMMNPNMMGQNMGQNMMGQNMMNPNMMGQNMMNPNMMGQNMMGQMQNPNVYPVQFQNLQGVAGSGHSEQGNIGLLMDVYMEMTVELGRTKKLIKDILGIGEGTILELDKLAGEPVDILVNHKLIAKGEVVVIDENFGVRVTEIVSSMDRISDVG